MEEETKKYEWVVSYRQLGLLAFVFILGLVTALLVSNAQTGEPTTFTTTELIGFVLSVILSGASIVLAVSAIALGKSSELAVIKRSDESIRLQNEVFIRTTEALQRIEASTGVTEKRIEDIISGRVGDISHQIAEMATSGGKLRPRNTKELEENIRQSLIRSIRSEESDDDLQERKKRREEEKRQEKEYQENHEKLLYEVANKEGVSIQKIGHGSVPSEGDDLFDGIFSINEKRIALSTFRPDWSNEIFEEYVPNAANALSSGEINNVIMVLFEHNNDEVIEKIKKRLALLKDEITSKIKLEVVTYEGIDEWIKNIEL